MKRKLLVLFGLIAFGGLLALRLVAAAGGAAELPMQLRPNADGTTTVRFQGAAGGSYRIESSDNLDAWTTLAASVTAQGEWTEWKDTRPPAQAQRFYRVTSSSGVTRTAMRAVDPNTDSERLLSALAAGDNQTVIDLLRASGVSESTLTIVSNNLSQTPVRVALAEPFFRGAISVPMDGTADEVRARFAAADALGYGRQFWLGKDMSAGWEMRYDTERSFFVTAPVGVLDFALGDTNLITFFKWYDRYAQELHSVGVNWTHLSNHTETDGYTNVNRTLSGLYKLIKARKPDAFVWAGVVKKDDRTDMPWLQAMTFKPDGLLIWNLRQFHSPFAETRSRFLPVVGAETPMVIASFYGYKPAVLEGGQKLKVATGIADPVQRAEAKATAEAHLGEVGKVSRDNLSRLAAKLEALGYRGLTTHGTLLEALEQAGK